MISLFADNILVSLTYNYNIEKITLLNIEYLYKLQLIIYKRNKFVIYVLQSSRNSTKCKNIIQTKFIQLLSQYKIDNDVKLKNMLYNTS